MNRFTRRIASQVCLAGKQAVPLRNVPPATNGCARAGNGVWNCLASCQVQNFATLAREVTPHQKQALFRTSESDPTRHGDLHHGLFYTIPSEIASRLFVLGGFEKEQQLMMKTFRETSIMVRRPALEIIDLLNKTDFDKPPNRFVLCECFIDLL